MSFFSSLFSAVLDGNLVFCQLVGMVSVLLVAVRPQDAFRFGGMLWAAVTVSGVLGWALYVAYLEPWGVAYLAPVVYVLVSTAVVLVAAAVAARGKTSEERAQVLNVYALVACNAALMAAPLSNAVASETTGFVEALGSSIGAGAGVCLAVVLFAFVRDRIDERLVPKAMRGLPISLVAAAIMALAFTGVAGIAGGLFA